METLKVTRFLAVAASIGILLVYGCGGGGGGGTTAQSTGTKSASAGATSAQQAVMVGKIGLSSLASGAKAPRLNMSKGGDLNALIASFTKDLNVYRAKAVAFAPQSAPCPGGGTLTFDSTTTSMTITYAACITTPTTGVTEYQDGTITITSSTGSFSIGMSNYTDRKTSTSGTLLSENTSNFTMSGTSSGASLSCGTKTLQNTFSLTMDGTISDKEDTNADGTLEVNMSEQMTKFILAVTINTADTSCNPTDSTITMSGGISATNNIQTNDSFSMNIATANPLTITAKTVTTPSAGENVTISGTFATTSSCFNGSLTIATPTAVFYPTGSENPTSGKIVITGDITGTVTYTSTGDVQVDEGSDGIVDKTYPSGTPIEACVG